MSAAVFNLANIPNNLVTFDTLMHNAYAPALGGAGPVNLSSLYTTNLWGSVSAADLGGIHPAGMVDTGGTLSGVTQGPLSYGDLQAAASGPLAQSPFCDPASPLFMGQTGICGPGSASTERCAGSSVLWQGPLGVTLCRETGLRLLVGMIAVFLLVAAFVGLVLPRAAPVIQKAAG